MQKRFIAGAVCPSCAAMDRLVIFEEDGISKRECVACGFTDSQSSNNSPLHELPTRVNHPKEQSPEVLQSDKQPELIPIKPVS